MHHVQNVLTGIAEVIDIIGIIILLYGFGKMLIKYLIVEIRNTKHTPIRKLQTIRCEIGIYILLALDFLIASDIIHSVTNLDQKQLIELSVMIIIRTAIGYFLGKEVEEIEHSTKKDVTV